MENTHFHIGEEPQLFVDSLLIEVTQGLTRRWHTPQRLGDAPVLKKDRPWEQTLYFTYSNYLVLRDPADGLIKCWYEDLGPLRDNVHPVYTRMLYAESEDGRTFRKPEMDICRLDGQPTNAVMGFADGAPATADNPWAEVGVHSCAIALDPHAGGDERFRALFSRSFLNEEGFTRHVIDCAHSADGLRWAPYGQPPTFGSSGSHLSDVSCIYYDPDARLFVQHTRHGKMYTVSTPPDTPSVSRWFRPYFPHRPEFMSKRRVYQTRSHDFLHWSDPLLVSCPDDAIDNLDEAHYGMGVFRVGRVYFGTLGVFRYVDNEMEVRLLYSRDGINFTPANRAQPFLAPRGDGHWDAHMVSMTSAPIEVGDEWWFYHGGASNHHDWWMDPAVKDAVPEGRDPAGTVNFAMGLAALRREGIASLEACAPREGYLITRPVISNGSRLLINGRCREGGSIRVEALDLQGAPLEGCTLEACDAFTGDAVAHQVTWGGNGAVPGANWWRKLRFVLRDAELFAFRFEKA